MLRSLRIFIVLVSGGNSGRAPGGWEVGIKHVNLDDSAIAKLPWLNSLNPSRQLQLLQIHRDQVEYLDFFS